MNALEIRNLSRSFPGFKLDDLSLTLPSGCIMGLIGENGAGKSTTIRLLLGALRKDGGEITILGRPCEGEMPELMEELGVVLDEVGIPACLDTKQLGNVMRATFRTWDDTAYDAYLKKFDIPEGKPFSELSQGTKMKVGIVVAMSHHPKLLILDEATNGLDPVARDMVVEMLEEFTREDDHSVLISSHIVSDLERICDYVAFLHKGKLMLCEEKDRLTGEYGILRCTEEQLRELDPAAILHTKGSAYGTEAIVRRSAVPEGMLLAPVSIEELFVHMVKEANE